MTSKAEKLWAVLVLCGMLTWTAAQTQAAATTAPLRIASLAPNLTQICYDLGLEAQVVCVTDFCRYPLRAQKKPKAGGLFNSNTELILSLAPTLVINQSQSLSGLDRLQNSGLHVVMLPCDSIAEIERAVLVLGDEAGAQDRAQQVLRRMRAELASVRTAVAARQRPRTLLVLGHAPGALRDIGAQGPRGFLHELLQLAGGDNWLPAGQPAYVTVSRESLMADPPDLVLEMRGDDPQAQFQAAEQQRLRALWKEALGGQADAAKPRVEFLNSETIGLPGTTIGESARSLAQIIHPGLVLADVSGTSATHTSAPVLGR